MKFTALPLQGAWLIESERREDSRGYFFRSWCMEELKSIGHSEPFVQHNQSYNRHRGTLRGMHFQMPPFAEVKLVRCISGRVVDVIVDLRKDSPTFLQHCKIELSPQAGNMMYIPERFAHGFQTLEDDSELLYFHTEYYKSDVEAGLRWDDPVLDISWPLPPSAISDRDSQATLLSKQYKGL